MRTLRKNIHWVVAILMLAVFGKHIYFLHNIFDFSWDITLPDAIISTLILTIATWGIILLIRAYPTTAAITLYALFVALFVSSLASLAVFETIKWWIGGTSKTQYAIWLKDTLAVRFLVIWIFMTWVATISAFRKNMAVLDSRFQKQADATSLHKEAELFKLRQQLQPHFLYNSLNSISALIMIEPDKAQEMIGKLSDFLRSSVKRESDDTIPIEEELRYIQSYLAIESVRFGDRLEVTFDNDIRNTDTTKIPPFLLQPILENAIKFGLYGNTGKVCIKMAITLQEQMLVLSVLNPYDPNMQPPRGTGFGLAGIQRRLYLMYARADLLETHKDEMYFTTILKIPQNV